MNPLDTAEIGTTELRISMLGLGGAALAGMYTDIADDDAIQTIRHALKLNINYLDTAPLYGHGRSEQYLGAALAGVPRDEYVLSTKVGRLLIPTDVVPNFETFANLPHMDTIFDYSRDGILRSLDESLQRLKLDRVDIVYIHDPDDHYNQAISEAYPTLADLRSQGVINAIGVGMNMWQPLAKFAREGDFDCLLLAGRYTLLDQSALSELMPLCERKGVSVILGGPYNSGILASDLSSGVKYDYKSAHPDVLKLARHIKSICDRHDVSLKAAALQFGLAHPAVVATIPGARSSVEVDQNIRSVGENIPSDMWYEMQHEGLIHKDAPLPVNSQYEEDR